MARRAGPLSMTAVDNHNQRKHLESLEDCQKLTRIASAIGADGMPRQGGNGKEGRVDGRQGHLLHGGVRWAGQ